MNLVVAVDREWGIGYQGNLLVAVKDDLSRFRKMTLGKTVVYGSATLRTFPNVFGKDSGIWFCYAENIS